MNTLYSIFIVAFFTFLGGSWLGYELALGRAQKAESELKVLHISHKALQDQADIKAKEFQGTLEKLQAESKEVISSLSKSAKEYKQTQTQLLAQKDEKIRQLQSSISTKTTDLLDLKSRLDKATTDKERAELRAEIAEQEKLLTKESLQKQGLECLNIPVPQEYLDNLNKLKTPELL